MVEDSGSDQESSNDAEGGLEGTPHQRRLPSARFRRLLERLTTLTQPLCGAVLLAVPLLMAWDYGGVMPWSQWLASCLLSVAALLAVPKLISIVWDARDSGSESIALANRLWTIPLVGLAAWILAWTQTVSLPSWLAWLFSRGSAAAYGEWIPDALRTEVLSGEPLGELGISSAVESIAGGSHPLSVSAELTRVALAGPALFAVGCLLSALIFRTRKAILTLLITVAVSGAGIAFFGIADNIRPQRQGVDQRLITPHRAAAPFGPFVCRNNAAGYLNLTLAAAIGVLVFSFLRAKSYSDGDGRFQLQPEHWWELPGQFFQKAILQVDAATAAALVLVILNLAGVLTSQSRGGSLAIVAGTVVTCLLTSNRSSRLWQPLAVLVTVGGVAILLGSIGLIEPIRVRLETIWSSEGEPDGRLSHWADALVAATHYFPAGAGLGTHRYAYLPYQSQSAGAWFVNADNLTVEWLVEGGIWLPSLVLVAIGLLVFTLVRLAGIRRASHLTALTAAGWYLLGSQLVCQFFDFGLLMPANYLTLALLVGAALGASSRRYGPVRRHRTYSPTRILRAGAETASATDRSGETVLKAPEDAVNQDPSPQPSRRQQPLGIWALPLAFGLLAIPLLHAQVVTRRAALHDHLVREIIRTDGDTRIADTLIRDPQQAIADPSLLSSFAFRQIALQVSAGRQAIDRLAEDTDLDPDRDAFPVARRAVYYLDTAPAGGSPDDALLPGQSVEGLLTARRYALAALMLSPLSDRPRMQLITTGFLVGSSAETETALLTQLGRLRSQNASMVARAARMAAIYPGGDVARSLVNRLLTLDSGQLRNVWPIFELLGGEEVISDLLPDNPDLLIRAVESRPLSAELRRTLLGRAANLLKDRLAERRWGSPDAAAAFLAGRLELAQGQLDKAEGWFGQAVRSDPSTPQYRFRWAEMLDRVGKRDEAFKQLEICIRQDPQNREFRARRDAWTSDGRVKRR